MSRIGKLAIKIPSKVTVQLSNNNLIIKGPLGEVSKEIPELLSVSIKDNNSIIVSRKNDTRVAKEFHGLYRSLINNMVLGVENVFVQVLEMKGVGYKGIMEKDTLILNVGYTHPIYITPPKGITISVENNTIIKIQGINKEDVGLLAQRIRATRPPEPYKGKGILYKGEVILRKVGKSSK